MFRCSKTFGHDLGLSAAFRQHRSGSHCRFMHGYALSFRFVFETTDLDVNGFVIDFGALGGVRDYLRSHFDHKTLVAKDDPQLEQFKLLAKVGAVDLVLVDRTGCEAFAKLAYDICAVWLLNATAGRRVKLVSCEVREHGANGATYYGSSESDDPQSALI